MKAHFIAFVTINITLIARNDDYEVLWYYLISFCTETSLENSETKENKTKLNIDSLKLDCLLWQELIIRGLYLHWVSNFLSRIFFLELFYCLSFMAQHIREGIHCYGYVEGLFGCYCIRGLLRLILKFNYLAKGWLQGPSMVD